VGDGSPVEVPAVALDRESDGTDWLCRRRTTTTGGGSGTATVGMVD
jgi:hypothetical protein